jgi:hypothetical protein
MRTLRLREGNGLPQVTELVSRGVQRQGDNTKLAGWRATSGPAPGQGVWGWVGGVLFGLGLRLQLTHTHPLSFICLLYG